MRNIYSSSVADCNAAVISPRSLKTLSTMISETFESTLKFMEGELDRALDAHLMASHGSYRHSVRGMHEVGRPQGYREPNVACVQQSPRAKSTILLAWISVSYHSRAS